MERLKGEGVQDWLVQHLTSPWHGHQTVASELGNDILVNIKERWSQLESSVRLGVLFSLISLKKAQQIQLREKCQELIDSACTDTDDWVKLISQMLKDYPKEASLRFNVEQFSGQEQLGSLMKVLQDNIVQNGIKFHPKEYAYLNESVCKAGQGKDPNTGTYPPPSGPSLQQHFSLRDTNSSIHTSRAERLKKMAEQASPILPLSANTTPPMGTTGTLPGQSGAGVASVAAGAAGTTAPGALPAPIPGGPPRPVRSASSGLFVNRKPAGFLRNNAPRPMPLPRNPSTGQLPLRSPRLDQPLTPRLNQKSSRIQILDIQQGNEIMQSMNDAKLRLEQAEQREKELKKEQRQQEMELKRQQDAEKKAQVLREKEEKKREREEAKKAKERHRQEREELLQQERDREKDQHRETRSPPEDDEDEGSLSSQPAKKRSRISSSRRGSRDDGEDSGNDKDRSESGTEPKSPITPSLTKSYSRHMIHDDEPPQTQTISMESAYTTESSSSRNMGESHQGQQQQFQFPLQQQTPGLGSLDPGLDGTVEHPTLFQNTNLLTKEDRAYITAFLQGHPVIRPNEQDTVYQIVMNQEQVQDATGKMMYELILIEMNFDTGEWRKIKRKRNKPHVEVSQLQQQ